jgi:hypothetical protein
LLRAFLSRGGLVGCCRHSFLTIPHGGRDQGSGLREQGLGTGD